jgi:hypothetical protein
VPFTPLAIGQSLRVEPATVIVVGPFDARGLGTRWLERAESYTVHADGSLVVETADGSVSFELDEWADVRFEAR